MRQWPGMSPVVAPRPAKRRVEDGLKLTERIVLRALDDGKSQASVARSHHYSLTGIEAMLRRLRALYNVKSTPALLRDRRVRAELDSADGTN